MDIRSYTDYFHDGGIIDIRQEDDKIEISMESNQLRPEWNQDKILLSNRDTIKGKLHLNSVQKIFLDQIPSNEIRMLYDDGEILNFDIFANKVKILVVWSNYPPKKRTDITEVIEIEAKEIYWENIPYLINPRD